MVRFLRCLDLQVQSGPISNSVQLFERLLSGLLDPKMVKETEVDLLKKEYTSFVSDGVHGNPRTLLQLFYFSLHDAHTKRVKQVACERVRYVLCECDHLLHCFPVEGHVCKIMCWSLDKCCTIHLLVLHNLLKTFGMLFIFLCPHGAPVITRLSSVSAQQSESCRERERWTGRVKEWSSWICEHGEFSHKTEKCAIPEIHVSCCNCYLERKYIGMLLLIDGSDANWKQTIKLQIISIK